MSVGHQQHPLITASHWIEQGHQISLATVMKTWGSAPRQAGSHLVICDDERFEGSVSGGCIEAEVITAGLDAQSDGRQRALSFGVSNTMAWQAGLACGGQVEVLVTPLTSAPNQTAVMRAAAALQAGTAAALRHDLTSGEILCLEDPAALEGLKPEFDRQRGFILPDAPEYFIVPLVPPPELIIIGAVHIAQHLTGLAVSMGYGPRIIDPRGVFAEGQTFAHAPIISDWPDEALQAEPPGAQSAVVTLTHDPKLDDAALTQALKSEAFYIGCLGSKKTHAARLARLASAGFDQASLSRLHGPVGLNIGAATPSEIALSILAQITAVRRGALP